MDWMDWVSKNGPVSNFVCPVSCFWQINIVVVVEKLLHREVQLSSLLDYIKELEGWRLDGWRLEAWLLEGWRLEGYEGDDVEYILHLLQNSPSRAPSGHASTNSSSIRDPASRHNVTRLQESAGTFPVFTLLLFQFRKKQNLAEV